MNKIFWYDKLGEKDSKKFEHHLIEWVKENGSDSFLIFDESAIKLEGILHVSGYGYLNTENLMIKWKVIAREKCILDFVEKKVPTNSNAFVIYKQPLKWKGAKLWYAYYEELED